MVSRVFATVPSAVATWLDGVFFDPNGDFLFAAVLAPQPGLLVLARNGVIVRFIPRATGPDGVAFHQNPDYAVTNDNNGTISSFEFPGNNYTAIPTEALLASGGFRGDLTQVGPDGCLYATQSETRFADGTHSQDDSIVRICRDFVPPSGVIPAAGAFVIGDLVANVGNTVTFWGAQWASSNPLSEGWAPSSFKGFVANTTPRCGQHWVSRPGNSSKPPASIPQFITVIASSKVSKAGSQEEGDVKRVVIVRTDSGYGPHPGRVEQA